MGTLTVSSLRMLFCFFILLTLVSHSLAQLCDNDNPTQLVSNGWDLIDCTNIDCGGQLFTCPSGKSCILDCSGPDISGGGKCYGTILDCRNAVNCVFKCHSDGTGTNMCRHAVQRCTNGAGFCMIDCYQPPGTSADNVCLHVHQDCNNASPCYYQCNNTECGVWDPRNCGNSGNCFQFCNNPPTGSSCPGCSSGTCAAISYCPISSPSATVSLSGAPSRTPSVSLSRSITPTVTTTPSFSSSVTSSNSPSITLSITPSTTASVTASVTPSVTASVTASSTASITPSVTPSRTATVSRTRTATRTATRTPSTTPTVSLTPPATVSAEPTKTASPSSSTSPREQPSQTGFTGLTCGSIPCFEDGDLCTVEACFDGACTHQSVVCDDFEICTVDKCESTTGTCSHETIDNCNDKDCSSKASCSDCQTVSGCSWLQCRRDDSDLFSNITTIMLNNDTQLMLFYIPLRSEMMEKTVDVWFRLNQWSAFMVDSVDFVAIGASQSQFSACLPVGGIDSVTKEYEEQGNSICEVADNTCKTTENQLSAQVGTISTSVGVAGGGAVGCFCGSCLVAIVFYRRKKKKDVDTLATIQNERSPDRHFTDNLGYSAREGANPLFEG